MTLQTSPVLFHLYFFAPENLLTYLFFTNIGFLFFSFSRILCFIHGRISRGLPRRPCRKGGVRGDSWSNVCDWMTFPLRLPNKHTHTRTHSVSAWTAACGQVTADKRKQRFTCWTLGHGEARRGVGMNLWDRKEITSEGARRVVKSVCEGRGDGAVHHLNC